jgi:hypothetical protein
MFFAIYTTPVITLHLVKQQSATVAGHSRPKNTSFLTHQRKGISWADFNCAAVMSYLSITVAIKASFF